MVSVGLVGIVQLEESLNTLVIMVSSSGDHPLGRMAMGG
mgnify:CR=1 FL=1